MRTAATGPTAAPVANGTLQREIPHLVADDADFRLGDRPRDMRDDALDDAAPIRAEVRQVIALRALRLVVRPDAQFHDAARGGVETALLQFRLHARAHLPQLEQIGFREELPDRRKRYVRAARDRDGGRFIRPKQHGDDRLRDERDGPGRADVELVGAAFDLARLERKMHRADLIALHLRAADLRDRAHAREMLALEARLLALRADVHHLKRLAVGGAQRERGAEHLPAALALRAVDCDWISHW